MHRSLEERILRLERSNRRLRVLGVLLGLTAVTCGSGVTSNFALVRTGRLDIVDDQQKVHVSIGARGGPHIKFSDAQGQVSLDAKTVRLLVRQASEKTESSPTPPSP
jgi:hypothetical protein